MSNGAAHAAASAGLRRITTNDSTSTPVAPPKPLALRKSSTSSSTGPKLSLFPAPVLSPPSTTDTSRTVSPSSVAAAQAVAKRSPRDNKVVSPTGNDESSIPATNTLVKMFEAKYQEKGGKPTSAVPARKPIAVITKEETRTQEPKVVSPIPVRPILMLQEASPLKENGSRKELPSPPTAAPRRELTFESPSRPSTKGKPAPDAPSRPSTSDSKNGVSGKGTPPAVPAPRGSKRQSLMMPNDFPKLDLSNAQAVLVDSRMLSKSPDRQITAVRLLASQSQPSSPMSAPPRSPVSQPMTNPKSLRPQLTADALANAIVASSLAARRSTSPRPPPPTSAKPLPAPPLSRKQSKQSTLSMLSSTPPNRQPSPQRPMLKQTLRPEPVQKDTNPYKTQKSTSHNVFGFKHHPNKHDEGSRKRYRDEITEQERKRYLGLWAANRGTLLVPGVNIPPKLPPRTTTASTVSSAPPRGPPLPSRPSTSSSAAIQPQLTASKAAAQAAASSTNGNPQLSENVHAYVVRDIWSRSKLGDQQLSEVWNLVAAQEALQAATTSLPVPGLLGDTSRVGSRGKAQPSMQKPYLTKNEFVVGTWLVDQCLKGRKMPMKVQDSVWASVRRLSGVNIPVLKK